MYNHNCVIYLFLFLLSADNASYISKSKVSLPLSKVKSIIKSDPDVALTGSEAVYLMTKVSTE